MDTDIQTLEQESIEAPPPPPPAIQRQGQTDAQSQPRGPSNAWRVEGMEPDSFFLPILTFTPMQCV